MIRFQPRVHITRFAYYDRQGSLQDDERIVGVQIQLIGCPLTPE
ncbi:hypothetical protein [Spirosoma foliorum]|nr:hypothetical protein [Spirosoma foliorum]